MLGEQEIGPISRRCEKVFFEGYSSRASCQRLESDGLASSPEGHVPERETDLDDSLWVRSMLATAENYTRHGVQHPHAQPTMGTGITPTNSHATHGEHMSCASWYEMPGKRTAPLEYEARTRARYTVNTESQGLHTQEQGSIEDPLPAAPALQYVVHVKEETKAILIIATMGKPMKTVPRICAVKAAKPTCTRHVQKKKASRGAGALEKEFTTGVWSLWWWSWKALGTDPRHAQ